MSKVAILLCTYNGQSYLAEQLDSIHAQTHSNWEVYVSDDGSSDDTLKILQHYQNKWDENRLFLHDGPSKGFAKNFLSLINKASIRADYYAYSDQDDIWASDKLQRAINYLSRVPRGIPALYCTRTQLINEAGENIGYSTHYKKPPLFANALVQNIGGGNTMVFNQAARSLLCEAGENIDVYLHDWWTYLVISGCGGRVYYDQYPSVCYRQHSNNLIGGSSGLLARLKRIHMMLQGYFKKGNSLNIQALNRIQYKLTTENQHVLNQFTVVRESWLLSRLVGLKRSGIFRQTTLGNLGLILAALLKKI